MKANIAKPSPIREALKLGSLFLTCLVMLIPVNAKSANITSEENYLGPFGRSLHIHVDGVLQDNDTEKLSEIAGNIRYSPDLVIHVTFSSPGGSLVEGLNMGRYISQLPVPVTTNVESNGNPSECASACVFAYLGGQYRFLREGSKLGVHRFYFSDDSGISTSEGVATTQIMAAEISSFITQSRASPELLSIMSKVDSQRIHWIPRKTLDDLRVVTGPIYSQSSEYKHTEGNFYLLLHQQSYYGENKLLVTCAADNKPLFMSFIQPADLDAYNQNAFKFEVTINEEPAEPLSVISTKKGPRFVETQFRLSGAQMEALKTADSVGARHMTQLGVFLGFEYQLDDDKLSSLIKSCKTSSGGSVESIRNQRSGGGPDGLLRSSQILENTDLTGNDYYSKGVKNVTLEDCYKFCKKQGACVAVSWVKKSNWCWPKLSRGLQKRNDGVTSVLVR